MVHSARTGQITRLTDTDRTGRRNCTILDVLHRIHKHFTIGNICLEKVAFNRRTCHHPRGTMTNRWSAVICVLSSVWEYCSCNGIWYEEMIGVLHAVRSADWLVSGVWNISNTLFFLTIYLSAFVKGGEASDRRLYDRPSLSVRLYILPSLGYVKKYWMDLHETWWKGLSWASEEAINFLSQSALTGCCNGQGFAQTGT